MTEKPTSLTMQAWSKLIRVEQTLLNTMEDVLKEADLPPLSWYDVLLELSREDDNILKLKDLESSLLLPQYNLSRLLDRMVKDDLIQRETDPLDKRGKIISLTPKGMQVQKNIWAVYGPALQNHVGSKLSEADAQHLIGLLKKLQ